MPQAAYSFRHRRGPIQRIVSPLVMQSRTWRCLCSSRRKSSQPPTFRSPSVPRTRGRRIGSLLSVDRERTLFATATSHVSLLHSMHWPVSQSTSSSMINFGNAVAIATTTARHTLPQPLRDLGDDALTPRQRLEAGPAHVVGLA